MGKEQVAQQRCRRRRRTDEASAVSGTHPPLLSGNLERSRFKTHIWHAMSNGRNKSSCSDTLPEMCVCRTVSQLTPTLKLSGGTAIPSLVHSLFIHSFRTAFRSNLKTLSLFLWIHIDCSFNQKAEVASVIDVKFTSSDSYEHDEFGLFCQNKMTRYHGTSQRLLWASLVIVWALLATTASLGTQLHFLTCKWVHK